MVVLSSRHGLTGISPMECDGPDVAPTSSSSSSERIRCLSLQTNNYNREQGFMKVCDMNLTLDATDLHLNLQLGVAPPCSACALSGLTLVANNFPEFQCAAVVLRLSLGRG
ncbi:hypothetical protein HHK36_013800 [Tetracentron sinense]|uniref:Uncharacterized protein n=1 Tax=Tetracentron sinense TaxID=13715 RepID=A0A835DH32_TETSI|nr:hypothetical protein HHK36_013800 [Tetracentron sinense]